MWPPHLLFPSSWGYNINYKVKTLNDVLRTTTKAALSVFLYYLRVWQEFYLFLKCLNQVFMSGKGKKRNIKLDSKREKLEKIILTDFLYYTKVLCKYNWMWSRKSVKYLHKLIKVLIWKYENQGNVGSKWMLFFTLPDSIEVFFRVLNSCPCDSIKLGWAKAGVVNTSKKFLKVAK